MPSVLVALLIGVAPLTAGAQAPYPNKPIRVVIPFGPGGFADITMRLVGQKLAERTGQQVVIENRPSAGGIIAAAAVTSAQPDGYTLFVLSSGIALSQVAAQDHAVRPGDRVHADLDHGAVRPAAAGEGRFADAHDHGRARRPRAAIPAKFNIGTINPGSTQNVTAELLRSATGIPITIVPHRNTAEVLTSLLRGDTQIGVESYAALKSPIDGGQIRAIAATGDKRSPMQPNVPTLKESGIDAVVRGLELAGRAGRHAEARSSPCSTAMSAPSSRARTSRSACSISAASPGQHARTNSTRG